MCIRDSIGILYTVGETNSLVQLETYKELAGDYGFTIVESGVTSGADIALAVPQLLPQVDCLTMLTDNTVVQYLEVVLDETDAAGIPVFGSEIEQVTLGCVAAEGLDYVALGMPVSYTHLDVYKRQEQEWEKTYTIGFGNISEANAINMAMGDYIVECCAAYGMEVIRTDNELNGTKAVQNVQTMLTRGIEGLIEFNVCLLYTSGPALRLNSTEMPFPFLP